MDSLRNQWLGEGARQTWHHRDQAPRLRTSSPAAHLFNHSLHLQLQGGQAPPEVVQQPLKLVLLSLCRAGHVFGLSQPGAQLLHVCCQCLIRYFSGREAVMALLWWEHTRKTAAKLRTEVQGEA